MPTKRKRVVVTADTMDKQLLKDTLLSQGNAIPPVVAAVIRLAAPIIARLAIRYVARATRKKISDATVQSGAKFVGGMVGNIISSASNDQ